MRFEKRALWVIGLSVLATMSSGCPSILHPLEPSREPVYISDCESYCGYAFGALKYADAGSCKLDCRVKLKDADCISLFEHAQSECLKSKCFVQDAVDGEWKKAVESCVKEKACYAPVQAYRNCAPKPAADSRDASIHDRASKRDASDAAPASEKALGAPASSAH